MNLTLYLILTPIFYVVLMVISYRYRLFVDFDKSIEKPLHVRNKIKIEPLENVRNVDLKKYAVFAWNGNNIVNGYDEWYSTISNMPFVLHINGLTEKRFYIFQRNILECYPALASKLDEYLKEVVEPIWLEGQQKA